ncbi:MAG TPA: trigger factor, partial [Gammaproteobacteria bacterium]|nr:trigger factor [Gammaproteobacteria bacterium]
MQVSFEQQDQFERKVTIEIPADTLEKQITVKLNDLAKKLKIPGFRPSKAPMKMVQGRYGESVRHEVVEKAVNQALFDAIEKEKVMPIQAPHVHMIHNVSGEPLKFYAHFEVYPEVKLSNVSQIKMDIPTPIVSDSDVAEVIERVQRNHAQWEACNEASRLGHRITVNFTGVIKGESEPFTDEKDVKITLGDKQMIPGFEDQLIGLSTGSHKQFNITFPEKYNEKLAGKETVFTIDVTEVEKALLPEITDEFCKDTLNLDTVEVLKTKIRESLQQEASDKVRRKLHKDVLVKLADLNKMDLPPSLVKNELALLQENKEDPNLPELARASEQGLKDEAQRRVLYSLLLGQIIRDYNIQVDQKKVQAAVMNIARGS